MKAMLDETSGGSGATANDGRRAALKTILDAWADAELDGVDSDLIAQAALFAAFTDLVTRYGETAVADLAARLPSRVRSGEFTIARELQ